MVYRISPDMTAEEEAAFLEAFDPFAIADRSEPGSALAEEWFEREAERVMLEDMGEAEAWLEEGVA